MNYYDVYITDFVEKSKLRTILLAICEHLNVTETEMKGKSRKRKFADARLIYYRIAYDNTSNSAYDIANLINRDRSNVPQLKDKAFYIKGLKAIHDEIIEKYEFKRIKQGRWKNNNPNFQSEK